MDKFEYQPATLNATTVKMDGPRGFVGTAENVRSREWAHELGKRNLVSAVRSAREVEVDFACDFETMDALRVAADADVVNRTPGTFVAQGEWKQRGYVVASAPKGVHFGWLTTQLTVALLDGAWWRIRGVSLAPGSGGQSGSGLDYAYDYAHDYSQPSIGGSIDTGNLVPSKPLLVFYGPVTNPQVIIGGNKYKVTASVAAGARIEVDGREKTVKMIAEDGTVTDKFASALRGSGEGGGEYIFEPIPPGDNAVTWDDTFGIDINWYDEVGEPPWSRS